MIRRAVLAPAVTLLICTVVVCTAFAQAAKPAAPTTPAPAAKAKFASPIKGEAKILVILGPSNYNVKTKEIVTTYKIKNISDAPIALLKIDEYWYGTNKALASTATERYKQPFPPNEVIEMTTHAPAPAGGAGWTKNAQFSHANGKVAPKVVKQF
jgi:hypothetical protein